jgi:hypothetical protein
MAKFKRKILEVEAIAAINVFEVETTNGPVRVNRGDMVVTDVDGILYPCRLDIFLKTYEATDDEGQQVIDLAMKKAHPGIVEAIKEGRIMEGVFMTIPAKE